MVPIRRIAIIALLLAIAGSMAFTPHRHDPGQDASSASCAVCQVSHSLPLAKPTIAVQLVRLVVVFITPPVVNPLIPRQIECLALAPTTSPPVAL